MARNFGGTGSSSGPKWAEANVRIGCCRRSKTNSLKPITTRKPSRRPRCPAKFHRVGIDRISRARSSFPPKGGQPRVTLGPRRGRLPHSDRDSSIASPDSAKRIPPRFRDASSVYDLLGPQEFTETRNRLSDLRRNIFPARRPGLRMDRIDVELPGPSVHLRVHPADEPVTP